MKAKNYMQNKISNIATTLVLLLLISSLPGCNEPNQDTPTKGNPVTPAPEDTTPSVAMFRGNLARTGAYQSKQPDKVLGLKWVFLTEGGVQTSPAVVDDIVYFGCADKNFYAVDIRTRKEIWKFKTEGHICSSPAVADGVVYFGCADKNFYALDAKTGKEKWKFETTDEINSSPAVADGVVYFGNGGYGRSRDNYLYALDAKTGKEKWKFKTKDDIYSSPAVADGVVFFGCNDKNFYAVDAKTGKKKWKFETKGYIKSAPAIDNGVVYFGSGRSSLDENSVFHALDSTTGKEKWKLEVKGDIEYSPAISDGIVYFCSNWGDDDIGKIYALNAKTGKEKWSCEPAGFVLYPLIVVGRAVYFGTRVGWLYEMDTETSELSAMLVTDNSRFTSPTIAGDTLYFGSGKGLYAVSIKSDREKWKYGIKGFFPIPPTFYDGVIYFTSGFNNREQDCNLIAKDAKTGKLKWETKTVGEIISSPIVTKDLICFLNRYNHLYAIDANTREEKWVFEAKETVGTPPIFDGNTIYLTDTYELNAIDIKTGDKKWTLKTEINSNEAPILEKGIIYMGCDGEVLAIDKNTGKKIWTVENDEFLRILDISGGLIFCKANRDDGYYLCVLDKKDGKEKWRYKTKIDMPPSLAVNGGVLYLGLENNSFIAIETKTGKEKWKLNIDSGLYPSTIEVSEDTVFFTTVTYYNAATPLLIAVEKETGREKWRSEIKKYHLGPTLLTDTVLYISCGDENLYATNTLYAINIRTGKKEWRLGTSYSGMSKPVLEDGILYYRTSAYPHSNYGFIHAIEVKKKEMKK